MGGTRVTSIKDTASMDQNDGSPGIIDDPGPGLGGLQNRSERSLRRQLFVGDFTAVAVAWGLPMYFQSYLRPDKSAVVTVAAIVSVLAAMKMLGLYRSWVCSEFSRQGARIIAAAAVGGVVLAASGWLAGSLVALPAAPAAEGAAVAAVLMIVLRWRYRRWLKSMRAEGYFLQPVVLVGTNEDTAAVWQLFSDEPELGYRVGGVVGKQADEVPWRDIPHRSALEELPQLAAEIGAEGVILVGSAVTAAESAAVVRASLDSGLHVQFWPGLPGVLSSRIRCAPVSGLPMLHVAAHRPPLWQMWVKRGIDIAAAAIMIPLFSPVLLAAAIFIWLEDRGPVIYRHAVIGRYGVQTEVLKLRTMVPNAAQLQARLEEINERKGGPLFKASRDPRVTRIGHFLRATSIDELPQLWDVLTGRMSLVGPRFAMPKEAAQFDEEHQQRRTVMRPGITGLWQTEARDNPSFSAYRRLDLLYIDNWSLGMDLAILVNTAHAVSVRAAKAVFKRGRGKRALTSMAVPVLAKSPGGKV
jgi:exopolysaccharide biosynthesis polyprenyl glycosylphosphotransferase